MNSGENTEPGEENGEFGGEWEILEGNLAILGGKWPKNPHLEPPLPCRGSNSPFLESKSRFLGSKFPFLGQNSHFFG